MRVGVETSPVGSSVGYQKALTSSEVVSEVFTATTTDATCVISFWGQNDSSTNEWVIDNVSIKEVTSASNQIQKRELGTGAFGPTPVGAYLPLAGGTMSGPTLHGDGIHSYWGASNDLQIDHDGNHSVINNLTGHIYISNESDDGDIVFRSDNGFGGVTEYFRLDGGSGYSVASKDIRFDDNVKAKFGISNDLQIYHDGSNSYITDSGTGNLRIRSTSLRLENTNSSNMVVANGGGNVAIYYNGSAKFSTINTGVSVTGDIQIDSALLSNQENTDVDTGTETVASVSIATYTAAFFDFVIKKGTNVRSGTVYACHDGTNRGVYRNIDPRLR